jgi:hypothetical protein
MAQLGSTLLIDAFQLFMILVFMPETLGYTEYYFMQFYVCAYLFVYSILAN